MTQRLLIITKQLAAAAAVLRMVLLHIAYVLHRQQLRPCSGMTGLAATLAATAFTPVWWLKPRAIAGGRFGRVARTAADPLPQAGQVGGQGGELSAELLDLLLLLLAMLEQLKKSSPIADLCGGPVRF